MTLNDDVTIGIKTFFRRPCLRRCIASIRKFYPSIQIIVADDSPKDIQTKNVKEFGRLPGVKILGLPFDVGLSAGRNAIVKACDTKYLQIIDDDTIFRNKTKIEILYRFLEEHNEYNLIGGNSAKRDHGYICTYLEIRGHKLYLRRKHFGLIPNNICKAVRTHRCLNYFMAHTEALQNHLWDARLKIAEHEDFFVRAWIGKKLTVAFTPDVVFFEKRQVSERYNKYRRKRVQKYIDMAEQFTYKCVVVKHDPPPLKNQNKAVKVVNSSMDGKKDNKTKSKTKGKTKSKTKGLTKVKKELNDLSGNTFKKIAMKDGRKKIIKHVNVIRSDKDLKIYKKLKGRD
jgi:glycosyltransferase involved in cell wall biosynthesis